MIVDFLDEIPAHVELKLTTDKSWCYVYYNKMYLGIIYESPYNKNRREKLIAMYMRTGTGYEEKYADGKTVRECYNWLMDQYFIHTL